MPFSGKFGNISKILTVDIKLCLKNLTKSLVKNKIKEDLTDFDIIFINNTLSCINYLLEECLFTKNEIKNLKNYLLKNEKNYLPSENFKVRYLHICLKIFETAEIDNLLENYNIDKRLLSIFLHDKII